MIWSADVSRDIARRWLMSTDVATELAACVPELEADWAVNAEDLELPTVALGHLDTRLIAAVGRTSLARRLASQPHVTFSDAD